MSKLQDEREALDAALAAAKQANTPEERAQQAQAAALTVLAPLPWSETRYFTTKVATMATELREAKAIARDFGESFDFEASYLRAVSRQGLAPRDLPPGVKERLKALT